MSLQNQGQRELNCTSEQSPGQVQSSFIMKDSQKTVPLKGPTGCCTFSYTTKESILSVSYNLIEGGTSQKLLKPIKTYDPHDAQEPLLFFPPQDALTQDGNDHIQPKRNSSVTHSCFPQPLEKNIRIEFLRGVRNFEAFKNHTHVSLSKQRHQHFMLLFKTIF